MIRTLMLAIATACAAAAQAPPLVTDRPDQTESAVTVPVGALQIEAGALAERVSASAGAQLDFRAVGAALLRYGVSSRLELRLGFGGWMQERFAAGALPATTTEGVGGLDAGAKLGLTAAGSRVQVALIGGGRLIGGSDAFADRAVDGHSRVALAVAVSDRLSVGINAGGTRAGGRTDGLYSAVAGLGLTSRVSAFAESFGSVPVTTGGAAAHALDAGLTVLVAPALQLDASAGVGINAAASDWFVGVGVSVRHPR